MKTHLHLRPVQPRRVVAGFTLIELMVVIAIMALLASLTMMGFGYANRAAKRNLSQGFHRAIESGLERYFTDNGEYPEPKADGAPAEFGGKSYPTGSAQMLYQAMSGDGNSAIKIASGGGTASNGFMTGSLSDKAIGEQKMTDMPKEMWTKLGNSIYILIDGFGHPFQYTKGPKATRPGEKANPNQVSINNTYDLWSFGEDDINTRSVTLSDKKGQQSAKWIKNW